MAYWSHIKVVLSENVSYPAWDANTLYNYTFRQIYLLLCLSNLSVCLCVRVRACVRACLFVCVCVCVYVCVCWTGQSDGAVTEERCICRRLLPWKPANSIRGALKVEHVTNAYFGSPYFLRLRWTFLASDTRGLQNPRPMLI